MRLSKDETIMIRDALIDPNFDAEVDDELEASHEGPDYDDSFNYDFHEYWPGLGNQPPVKTE